jgi:hypothetical protein
MLLHLWFLFCVPSFISFRRRPTSPQCPDTRFSNPDEISGYSLHDFQPDGLPDDPVWCTLLWRNCFLKPWTLIPLLASWRVRCLLSSVRPLGVPLATLSWPCTWRPCPLRRAGMTRRVTPLHATANDFPDPPLPWVLRLSAAPYG